jgi:hypothetical protein
MSNKKAKLLFPVASVLSLKLMMSQRKPEEEVIEYKGLWQETENAEHTRPRMKGKKRGRKKGYRSQNTRAEGTLCSICQNKVMYSKPVLRSWSRSRKEPHLLVGAGAVTRCGSGSDNGIKHGWELKIDTKRNSL